MWEDEKENEKLERGIERYARYNGKHFFEHFW